MHFKNLNLLDPAFVSRAFCADYTPGIANSYTPGGGMLEINTQADVDLLTGYDRIAGDLTIHDTALITNAAPLNGIKEIDGNFIVDVTCLPSVIPMTDLRFVGGFSWIYINVAVTDVDGFCFNLTRLGSELALFGGDSLTSLGLNFMRHLHYAPILKLQLAATAVASLDGLFPCFTGDSVEISVDPSVGGVPAKYDLTNAFPSLVYAGSVDVAFDAATDYTSAFAALATADSLSLSCGEGIPGFDTTLSALTTVDGDMYLYLEADAAGAKLPPLASLTTVAGTLQFETSNLDARAGGIPTLPALTTIGAGFFFTSSSLAPSYGGQAWDNAFPVLTSAPGSVQVNIDGVTSMQNFMPLVPAISDLFLSTMNSTGVAGLTDMTGAFSSLTVADVYVAGVDLTSLNFLSSLTAAYTIYIDNNAFLTVVMGLIGVVGSTCVSLVVTNNPLLPTVAQVDALHANYVGEGFVGVYTNTGNGPG